MQYQALVGLKHTLVHLSIAPAKQSPTSTSVQPTLMDAARFLRRKDLLAAIN